MAVRGMVVRLLLLVLLVVDRRGSSYLSRVIVRI